MFGKGDYAGALATFQHANRQQPDDPGPASWLSKSKEALEQQKRRLRVSVDYSRFHDLQIEEDDEALSASTLAGAAATALAALALASIATAAIAATAAV